MSLHDTRGVKWFYISSPSHEVEDLMCDQFATHRFPSTSYFNFTFYCNRANLCSHVHRRSIHFFLLQFKLFLNNTHVLLGLMGQTSVDVKQI